jgi:hypothetical protein
MEPAINNGSSGFLGVTQIAPHNVGAAQYDFTVETSFELGPGGIHDPDFMTRERNPDSPGSEAAVWSGTIDIR